MNAPKFHKVKLFNTYYAVVDYQSASDIIIEEAQRNNSFGVFALPVHGLIPAVTDKDMAEAVSKANMIVPDGQPIRWAMNHLYKVGLKDRVYGPILTLHVLEKANQLGLKIFLYGGNTEETLEKFATFIQRKFPNITICGKYREDRPDGSTLSSEEINQSGAHIILIGRGCPMQEKWVASRLGEVKGVMMAVGAAFSFHAGTLRQAPKWMQDRGLEWLFRLIMEPRRLWKRYLFANSYFIWLFFKFKFFGNKQVVNAKNLIKKNNC